MVIHWSLANVQRVLPLVDTRAKCTFLYGNPDKFSRPEACFANHGGYGGYGVKVRAMWLALSIGHLPPPTMNILLRCPPFLNVSWDPFGGPLRLLARVCGESPHSVVVPRKSDGS